MNFLERMKNEILMPMERWELFYFRTEKILAMNS